MAKKNEVATNAMKTQTFNNDLFGELTVINIDKKPWFLAKEVADMLEYSSSSAMLKRLDADYTNTLSRNIGLNSGIDVSNGGKLPTVINEYGIIEAVLGSNKSEAKKFKKWIIEEVIPSVMKTGSYTAKPLSRIELLEQMLEMERANEVLQIEDAKKVRSINQGYKSVIGRKSSIIDASKDALGVVREKDVPVAIRETINESRGSVNYKQLSSIFNTTTKTIKGIMIDCGLAKWGNKYNEETGKLYRVLESTSYGTEYSSYYTFDGSPRLRWSSDIIDVIKTYMDDE